MISKGQFSMNRNILYVVIAALAVPWCSAINSTQERQKTTGIEINVGKSGISIEQK
jgi:hypothetical protein